MKVSQRMLPSAALAPFLFVALTAQADPADYIKVPTIEAGEKEVELKYGTAKLPGNERLSAGTIGFGYGVNSRWFTEGYLKYQKEPGATVRYDAFEWENKVLLTEQGEQDVDIGWFLETEVPRNRDEGYEFRWGPMFQGEIDRVQLNGNIFLSRQIRAVTEPDEPSRTELSYQFQVKYRWQREFEFGLQAFGEMGPWRNLSPREQQNHRVGPAVFGKLPLGGHHALRYDAAWLYGASKVAPGSTFRLQLEYEF